MKSRSSFIVPWREPPLGPARYRTGDPARGRAQGRVIGEPPTLDIPMRPTTRVRRYVALNRVAVTYDKELQTGWPCSAESWTLADKEARTRSCLRRGPSVPHRQGR